MSQTYTIGRLELAYATSGLYIRSLWWALIGMPLGGLGILFTMQLPLMKYLGTVMVLWPVTIPGRALIITSDQRKLYIKPTVTTFREKAFFLDPEGGTPTRIPLTWIKRAMRRGDMWLLVGDRGKLAMVKATAFSEEGRKQIEVELQACGVLH